MKKDEFVCNCSDIDDIIIFYRDGKFKVVRVADKLFVGKNVLHLQVFKKNDSRTTYNLVYRDGKNGPCFIKRFNVTGITRDREVDATQGKPGTKVLYFTANPNGEAEIIKVTLDSILLAKNPRKKIFLERDFAEISIKGRGSKGYLLTRDPVHRISLKSHGHSTLGGRKVWFDPDVRRLNFDEHGRLLGEFSDDDQVLVVLSNGDFYVTTFDPNNHFEDNILRIEKFKPEKVWTAVLYDADNDGYAYVKRFLMEATKKHQNYLGENPESKLILLSDEPYPRIRVTFSEGDAYREPMEIEVEEFIGVKGFKAKGKRLTTWKIGDIEELEPTRKPEEEVQDEEIEKKDEGLEEAEVDSNLVDSEENSDSNSDEPENNDSGSDESASPQFKYDPETGQLSLFGE